MEKLYYCIFLGEADTRYKVKVGPPVYLTKQQHIQFFFDDMVKVFSHYEKCYVPQSISDLDVEKVCHYSICRSGDVFLISFDGNNIHQKVIKVGYGVSGGLHLYYSILLIEKGTQVGYLI